MRSVRASLLSFAAILVSASLLADAGMWGNRGISRRFIVSGDRLYAADGRGVTVYDVADPSNIRRVDVELLDDETHDVALIGTTDLVAATSRGIQRFAIGAGGTLSRLGATSETGAIDDVAAGGAWIAAAADRSLFILQRAGHGVEIVQKITLPERATAIASVGSYLYVSVHRRGTFVFAPPSTEPLTIISNTGESFALAGSMLWLSLRNSGITAIDVTDPASPAVIGTTGGEHYRIDGIAAAGSRLYAFEKPATIRVFDVTSPKAPQLMATLNEWVDVMAASGAHLFITGPRIGAEATRYETGLPLRVFDATNLASPRLAGEVTDLAGPVSGVWTDGSLAYVVDPPYLRVLDVSKTAQPRELSSLQLPSAAQESIVVKNGIAIVYGRGLVHIIDVSSPLRPALVGTWDARGHPKSDAAILKDLTFVEANEHSGLHIVDYTDPASAVQIGGRIWHYQSLAAGDDAVYVLQESQLLTLQIENRKTVIDRMFMHMIGAQIETAPANVSRPRHLITRGAESLLIFSLADRFNPELTAEVPVRNASLLGTGDGIAYVAIDGTLHSLNLDGVPMLAPTAMRVTSPMQISVAGEKIVVADRYSVRVFGPDTAPPPSPSRRRRAVGH